MENANQTITVSSSEMYGIEINLDNNSLDLKLKLPGLEPLTLGDVTITDGEHKCYGKIKKLELTVDGTIVDIEMYPF